MASTKHVQRAAQLRAATARSSPPPPAAGDAPVRPGPLIDLTADAFDPDAVEQIDLFEINGVMYTIPAESSASLLLEVMQRNVADGEDAAMWWLLEELLGDGVTALRTYRGLTIDHIAKLFKVCQDTLTGQLDDPKDQA